MQSDFPRIGAPLNFEPIPSLQWIEVATSLQIPSFQIIGLPAPEVTEARERVRSAIEGSGLEFPRRRVVVNLSPASVRKRGTGADLAMALGVLSSGATPARTRGVWVAWAELGLDGKLKPAGQVLRAVYAAWEAGADFLLVSPPERDSAIAHRAWLANCHAFGSRPYPKILAPENLADAWELFTGTRQLPEAPSEAERSHLIEERDPGDSLLPMPPTFERIVGVAAAGFHHLLLLGPRGTGKSHALEWLVALHPPASPVSRLKSRLLEELAGSASDQAPVPVKRVGSGARPSALIGFASPQYVRPGAFSLAHGGILVADEFLEWSRDSRETLREPLERGKITLTRAHASLELPARFTLAANGNLCACGGWPRQIPLPMESARSDEEMAPSKPPLCRCSASARRAYLGRLSGPILDRIDLVHFGSLRPAPGGRGRNRLSELRSRVAEARIRMLQKWGGPAGHLNAAETEAIFRDNPEWERICSVTSGLSLRARHKVLRLALSLAAWDGNASPRPAHFAEAACYRAERFGLGEDSGDQNA